MEEILGVILSLTALIIIGGIWWVNTQNTKVKVLSHSPTQALTTGDQWYKQALNMARLLERMKNDPTTVCTFDTQTKADVDRVLQKFWSDHELE